jgi:hypothetical protein
VNHVENDDRITPDGDQITNVHGKVREELRDNQDYTLWRVPWLSTNVLQRRTRYEWRCRRWSVIAWSIHGVSVPWLSTDERGGEDTNGRDDKNNTGDKLWQRWRYGRRQECTMVLGSSYCHKRHDTLVFTRVRCTLGVDVERWHWVRYAVDLWPKGFAVGLTPILDCATATTDLRARKSDLYGDFEVYIKASRGTSRKQIYIWKTWFCIGILLLTELWMVGIISGRVDVK